jgi:hypothetical protein
MVNSAGLGGLVCDDRNLQSPDGSRNLRYRHDTLRRRLFANDGEHLVAIGL